MSSQSNPLIQSIADEMRRLGEGCTRDDLELSFTSDELDRYGPAARQRANEDAIRYRRRCVPARAA